MDRVAAAGVPVPPDTKLDGVNLLPYLRGEKTGAPHEILFWKNDANGSVRQGDWKLIRSAAQPQLFNLATDLAETKNLAAEQPECVKAMNELLEKYITEGRSTPGAPQKNDVEVKRYPTKSKRGK